MVVAGQLTGAETDFTDGLTPGAFQAAGLHKLTATELARLNDLIAGRTAEVTAMAVETAVQEAVATTTVAVKAEAKAEVKAELEAEQDRDRRRLRFAPTDWLGRGSGSDEPTIERERIESTLVGAFRGWSGRTVFTLANGQRWQQVDNATFTPPRAMENVKVTLTPSRFSGYFLQVEGFGSACRVMLLGVD